jgi:serine/threonine protein kinase
VYEIVGPLGAGGMGEVYRARASRLRREVAIKVLPADVAGDPARRARFEREAHAVASLSHPNIHAIHDIGSDDGVTYAVMELLDGRTLREVVGGGPRGLREAVDVARQIGRGLEATHTRGLVLPARRCACSTARS